FVVANDRVAIAIFTGVVDFHRNAREALDHELASESGMPTGAAGGDVDLAQGAELGVADLHLFEIDAAAVEGNATECGVADGARLLVDLFEHKVLEAALFRHDR